MKTNKKPSNRNFGIVFFILFLIIATYPLLNDQELRMWSLILALIFFILGIINSNLLNPLNNLWFKFGILLGKIFSPIILFFIFFLMITPIGIFMRIIKKDLLGLKFNNESSYWIKRSEIKSKMKNQF